MTQHLLKFVSHDKCIEVYGGTKSGGICIGSKEVRNLLVYKKALLNSNFVDESKLLESVRPLLDTKTLWHPHGLILLGDYFVSKGEYIKAREFYQKIFAIKNLEKDFYYHASSQLALIVNE